MRFSKNIVALFFFLNIALSAFSQRLEYGNFLQTDTAVKWSAVYHSILDLSTVNPNFDITKFYLRKLKDSTVSIYPEDENFFAVERSSADYKSYQTTLTPVPYSQQMMNWKYDFSEGSDVSEWLFNNEETSNDSGIQANKRSFAEVKQLLYFKNNQFYVQNILLHPIFYKKHRDETKEQARFYTGAALAFNGSDKAAEIPASARFITRTSNCLNLAIYLQDKKHRSLTTHQNTLFRELFWGVKKGKLKAFDTDFSFVAPYKFLRKDTVENYHSPLIEVPMFDENGNLTGKKFLRNEYSLDSIYVYNLTQDIYFDFATEKLYSKVISVIPMHRVVTAQGVDLGYGSYWGIPFDLTMPPNKTRKK